MADYPARHHDRHVADVRAFRRVAAGADRPCAGFEHRGVRPASDRRVVNVRTHAARARCRARRPRPRAPTVFAPPPPETHASARSRARRGCRDLSPEVARGPAQRKNGRGGNRRAGGGKGGCGRGVGGGGGQRRRVRWRRPRRSSRGRRRGRAAAAATAAAAAARAERGGSVGGGGVRRRRRGAASVEDASATAAARRVGVGARARTNAPRRDESARDGRTEDAWLRTDFASLNARRRVRRAVAHESQSAAGRGARPPSRTLRLRGARARAPLDSDGQRSTSPNFGSAPGATSYHASALTRCAATRTRRPPPSRTPPAAGAAVGVGRDGIHRSLCDSLLRDTAPRPHCSRWVSAPPPEAHPA